MYFGQPGISGSQTRAVVVDVGRLSLPEESAVVTE